METNSPISKTALALTREDRKLISSLQVELIDYRGKPTITAVVQAALRALAKRYKII